MPALTDTDARARSASIAVTAYDVALDLTGGNETFGSRTAVEFTSRDGADTFIDMLPDRLVSARLNDREIDTDLLQDGRLPLSGLAASNVLVVETRMRYSHDGEGLHRAADPEDGRHYVYAMAFLQAAPRIFACFDQPDLKATYQVGVQAPVDWTVVGNGRAAQTSPGVWTLAETKPLSTYLVTLVAGPYHCVTRTHDSITLGLLCRQSLAPHLDKDCDEVFEVTGQCFDEYHRLFGIRYPFGDYYQAFVPEFAAGAMENPGCVTFTDELVFKAQATDSLRATRTNIIAHEMAHQWFGDLVTMRWWDDLWLNESFAEYMGYRVTSQVTAFDDVWVEFAHVTKAWGLAADQRSSTHPVAGNGASDTRQALSDFDGISYSKGAAALRQLNAYLGDDAFIGGVIDHLHQHSYGNATLADLIQSWEQASDKDVASWAQAWLRTAGVDTLTCLADPDSGVVVLRSSGSVDEGPRPHAFTVTWYGDDGLSLSAPVLVDGDRAAVDLPSYDGSGLVVPDSGDETWAKVKLDDASRHRAPGFLTTIDDPVARAVIWGSLREALLDAAIGPAEYLAAVAAALPAETDLAVEKILGSTGSGAIGHLGTYLGEPGHRSLLAQVAEEILLAASPSTNRQLIAARALVTLTDDDQLLRGWLAGDGPDGLRCDADLRWRITRALCELGASDLAEVEAEQARDRSSQGGDHALRCRASLPDSEVKAQVWDSISTDASLTNYALFALCEFFFRPGQVEMTRPFVERYFTDFPSTENIRMGSVVESSARLAFPRFAVSAETVSLAERCLAGEGVSSGTRRSVSDRTDDLHRVLQSRQTYAVVDEVGS